MIKLTPGELETAAYWAVKRACNWISESWQHSFRNDRPWANWIESAAAEMAVARHLNLYWIPYSHHPSDIQSDVGSGDNKIQVKSSPNPEEGWLRLRSDDSVHRPDHRYYLVLAHGLVQHQTLEIVGYIDGEDAFRDEYFVKGQELSPNGRPCRQDSYWVPIAHLKSAAPRAVTA